MPSNKRKNAEKAELSGGGLTKKIVFYAVIAFIAVLCVNLTPMAPPPPAFDVPALASEWSVTASVIERSVVEAGKIGTYDVGIIFLLAKGIALGAKASDGSLNTQHKMLLNPPNQDWKARRALLNSIVVSSNDITFDYEPPGWQTFADFLSACPAWQDKDAYIFHVAKSVTLARRHQLSGLSYMHAPLVLQHYLVSLHQPDVGMIDMTKYIRQRFSSEQLQQHIFDNKRRDSSELLEVILEPDSMMILSSLDLYEQHLKQYGPGLVSGFRVFDDFYNGMKTSFDGAPRSIGGKSRRDPDALHGLHAMLLIGVRREAESGKRWFLLQNWWKHSQFVEVSEEYLTYLIPPVYFVKTPPDEDPRSVSGTTGLDRRRREP